MLELFNPKTMNRKYYIIFLLFSIIVCHSLSFAQISGTVFRDINNDGIRQMGNPTEPGEHGINVRAYNASNVLLASVNTNPSGFYIINAAQAPLYTEVRLEFILPSGNFPSKRMGANRSNIQFVVAGPTSLNIDFAIASSKMLSNSSNPFVATTAYVNGDATATSGSNAAGRYDNVHVFPYDLSSNGGNSRRTKNQYTGSLFGLAWQKETRTLLMAAYLKRHTGFGPNGIGAIYQTQISTAGNPSNPSLLVDVNNIGINVGTNPRTSSLPANASTPNTDNGVFANVGKRGIGGIELGKDGKDLYLVNMFEKKLHRINIGNPLKTSFTAADVTGNWNIPDPNIVGTIWHPMALKMYNGKFYIGGICTRETTGAHNIADTANMKGVVFEFDPSTNSFAEVLRFSLSHRRGFVNQDFRYENRNNFWSAWQNNGDISLGGPLRTGLIGATTGNNATGIYYAQPMFSAIEFDIDGSMIIGIRDRFGDQGGYANLFETGNVSGETYRTLSSGEVLRAGKNNTNWVLENACSVTTNGVTTTTYGLADNNFSLTGSFASQTGTPYGGNYGPGGRYYYYNFNFSVTGVPAPFNTAPTYRGHYLKSLGGLAYLPGYNEVLTTAIDPVDKAYSNGIIKNVNLGAQAGNMAARMELLVSASNDPATMGKAAAFGDLEILTDVAKMEIGNRIWEDQNTNGIQDAHEPGMGGITVNLRSPGADNLYNTIDDQVWTTTTDIHGNYYFDETIVNDTRRPAAWIGVSASNSGILPGFEYKVEINELQPALAGFIPTLVNVAGQTINSKGNSTGSIVYYIFNPGGPTLTNSNFENNYNVDFGFFDASILPIEKLDISALLYNNVVDVKWSTTDELDVNSFEIERSVDGNVFNYVGIKSSKGNGSFNYNYPDNISALNNSAVYYRLKVINKNGKSTYSKTVKVLIKSQVNINAMPNPFSSYLKIEITTKRKTNAVVNIYSSSGQKVFTNKFIVNSGTTTHTISQFGWLPKGAYLVDVITEESTLQRKMLKE